MKPLSFSALFLSSSSFFLFLLSFSLLMCMVFELIRRKKLPFGPFLLSRSLIHHHHNHNHYIRYHLHHHIITISSLFFHHYQASSLPFSSFLFIFLFSLFLCPPAINNYSKGDVTLDDSQRQFLAQHSVATMLRHCFEWLQHCSNIAAPFGAKNCRCQLSCVTSP